MAYNQLERRRKNRYSLDKNQSRVKLVGFDSDQPGRFPSPRTRLASFFGTRNPNTWPQWKAGAGPSDHPAEPGTARKQFNSISHNRKPEPRIRLPQDHDQPNHSAMPMGMTKSRIKIIRQAIAGLVKAWAVKTRKQIPDDPLPLVDEGRSIDDRDISFVIRTSDLLVRFGALRTGRKCFFRSFIIASVLRRWGIPVEINFGLRNIGQNRRETGHCWLTLDGRPYAEKSQVQDLYPIAFGAAPNGVSYWYGEEKDDGGT